MLKTLLTALAGIVILSGCNFNSSIMLRTKKDFKYSIPTDSTQLAEYKISSNDLIDFRIFTNDGFKLIDLTSLSESGNAASVTRTRFSQEYLVEHDGMMKLPILGRLDVKGMTIREAEKFLEEKYSEFYIKPFILMNVINRRVIVFPGQHGAARVIPLNNNNTTLIEALALAGGIAQIGKAKKIKLIRGNLTNPEVFLIDLSTINGMQQADLVLQANDVIYVEPRLRITQGAVSEIAPLISLITSAILLYTFSTRIF
ncbi:MAG: polysaccharide biosynthesis/export family protein [Bacteroidetes bacterium]|nr:polysaccharide biosynthesis/export family protein [Bacteroidota bacterium]HET6243607.1 polysaccharide biosynthesis/export family protein [Bacteroidia bacterium]